MISKISKILFFSTVCLSFFLNGYSANEVGGGITVSTAWAKNMSPIHVINDVSIDPGVTLTIEPGVDVIFQGDYKIEVRGELVAEGTETDSIRFFAADSMVVKEWKGIEYAPATIRDNIVFKYLRIEHCSYMGLDIAYTDNLNINNCLFTNNTGISLRISLATGKLSNNIFANNNVTYYYNTRYASSIECYKDTLTIVNNLFLNNTSLEEGGALYTIEGDYNLSNNSFIGNNAKYGGAIYLNDNIGSLRNNIYWNNSVTFDGENVFLRDSEVNIGNSSFEKGASSIYNNNSTITYTGGTFSATNLNLSTENTAADGPNFTGPANNNYTLAWNSPLINTGDTVGISHLLPPTDIAGNARIQHNIIDMGAYESSSPVIELVGIAGQNGTVSPEKVRVEENGSQVFTIKANGGYTIDTAYYATLEVTDNIMASADSFLYTATTVIQNDTLRVWFKHKHYIMRSEAGDNGTVTPDSVSAEHGTSFTYTITPAEGFVPDSATYAGADVTADLVAGAGAFTYTIDSVIQSDTLQVYFDTATFEMKSEAGNNGTVSPEQQTVSYNGTITYTITPEANYYIATATYNGTDVRNSLEETGSNYTYTVDNIQAAGTLNVTFSNTPITGVAEAKISQLKVYPNPASSKITIEGKNLKTIELINITGNLIEQVQVNESKTTLNLSNYPKGMYFVKVNTDTGTQLERIIKE